MTAADWIACLVYVLASGLVLLAFGNRSKAADNLADEMADRLLHGDVRQADLLKPPHGMGS